MKYCIHTFVLIFLLLILTSCENWDISFDSAVEIPQKILFQYDEAKKFPVMTIPVDSSSPIDCVAQNSETIFILSNMSEEFSNLAKRTTISAICMETGEKQEIYDISGEEHWCNELKATDNYLFWVYSDASSAQIMQYDLQTSQMDVVREFPANNTIIMGSDNRFLSWYESMDSTKKLYVLDTESRSISLYPEQQKTASPYSHPYVIDHILISCETSSEGKSDLCAYDLVNDHCFGKVSIEDFSKVNTPQANRDWIVWMNEERNIIWAYNILSRETIEIANEYYAFSYHLSGDIICVNDRISNSILLFDLKSGQALTNQLGNLLESSFVLGSAYNSQVVFLDEHSENLVCFNANHIVWES